ncbi:MAG TPA: hypothetical protein VMH81_30220 [Bryobacteraceae bacterium]|nr:hypothetical protein [Bryobacteraceae bacterium]
MHPVILTDAAWIDDVREVVFGVSEHKVGVRHSVAASLQSRFSGWGNSCGPLDRRDGLFRSGEANESAGEEVQPAADCGRRITRGIGGHEDELDLISAPGANRRPTHKHSTLPWMLAGLASVISVISLALLWRATRPVDRPMMRFSIDLGPVALRGRSESGEFYNPVISPDGTRLVFSAKAADGSEQLAMRRLDQSIVTMLAGTERAVDPFFSPDGQWIGFFAGQKLKKIPLLGGGVVTLCDAGGPALGASWGDSAIIASLDRFHLFRVPAAGGEAQVLGKPEEHGERTWRWPQALPGGENVLFTGAVAASGGALDSANIEVLSVKSGRVKVVRHGGFFRRYLPSCHLIYIHEGTLYGVPFDLARLETRGAPAALFEDIDRTSRPSFSRAGTLLYTSAAAGVAPISWLDSAGTPQRVAINESRQGETPRLSPDGNRLALAVAGDLFVHDLQRGTVSRLTSDSALNRHPVWTPDGQHIIYGSDVPTNDGEYRIWSIRADGSSQPEKLFGERTPLQVFSISPDGHALAFVRTGQDKGFESWILPLNWNDPDHPKPGNPEPLARESQAITHHRCGRSARLVVRQREHAPGEGVYPKHREIVSRNVFRKVRLYGLACPAHSQQGSRRLKCGQFFETKGVIPELLVKFVRDDGEFVELAEPAINAAMGLVSQPVQLARIPNRQRLQQHRMNQREDRRGGADAEGQRDGRREGEYGRLAQPP